MTGPLRFRLRSGSAADTFEIGRLLADSLPDGCVLALAGDLGAGKTLFCQGLAAGLGIDPSTVTSPTFTIVAEHDAGRLPFRHVDAYRLSGPAEGVSIGLDEMLGGEGIVAVEWPENVAKLLPNRCLRVTFLLSGSDARILSFELPNQSGYQSFLNRCKRYLTGG
jgi:tRNA threonylcarbamoyladenosine biosynthesis protein TsaE